LIVICLIGQPGIQAMHQQIHKIGHGTRLEEARITLCLPVKLQSKQCQLDVSSPLSHCSSKFKAAITHPVQTRRLLSDVLAANSGSRLASINCFETPSGLSLAATTSFALPDCAFRFVAALLQPCNRLCLHCSSASARAFLDSTIKLFAFEKTERRMPARLVVWLHSYM
jgi:hypothetical protein